MPLPTTACDPGVILSKDEITEQIREWIVTLRFAPGEKIVDTEIASYFGVSRTPIREVLKLLEQQKLICTFPGKGTFVAGLHPENIYSLYLPMQTLQCLAVRLACDNAAPEDIAELEEINRDFLEKAESRDDTLGLLKADKRFHQKLVDMARNEYIDDFCSALWTHIARLDYIYFRDSRMLTSSYTDHVRMIKALSMRDPFSAERAMRDNWNNSMLGIMALTDKKDEAAAPA